MKIIGAFILGALGDNDAHDEARRSISRSSLNPSRVQFSLLTPYPGTKLFEKVKEKLLTKNWAMYSGLHPTIKLDKITPQGLNRFLFKAYAGFYLQAAEGDRELPVHLPDAAERDGAHLHESVLARLQDLDAGPGARYTSLLATGPSGAPATRASAREFRPRHAFARFAR